jgi:hypothetical protein
MTAGSAPQSRAAALAPTGAPSRSPLTPAQRQREKKIAFHGNQS